MKKHLATHLLIASVLLASCQSTPVKDAPEATVPTLADAEQLLGQASNLPKADQARQLLNAAALFLSLNEPARALQICQPLEHEQLGDALYAKHSYIQSQALIKTGSPFAAKGQLEEPRLQALLNQNQVLDTALSTTLNAVLALRAELYYDIGEQNDSLFDRFKLSERLAAQPVAPDDQQFNQELIWMTLMEQDLDTLLESQLSAKQQDNQIAQGWLSLAVVSKNNQRNITQQYQALQQWQTEWREHPANNPLPADLALIAEIVHNQPKKVALLLPLTGKLASASSTIRDGFMAAHFTNHSSGGIAPDIRIYDVSKGSITEHYDFAVAQGAEVIIGPLSKSNIDELALRPELPVPTLALNTIDASDMAPQELFQFGLSVEDEARQAAERAIKDGKLNALLLLPSSTQGDRAGQAFIEQWQALGGTVADAIRYNNPRELSQIIASAMHIDDSKARAKKIRQRLGSVQFEPRPRKDVDMIFLVAQPRLARQIKPLFAFHYAGNIPIYSTSSIYEGNPDVSDADLNGIQFSHLPWFFSDTLEKRQLLDGNETNSARAQRLYALGVDSYYLYPRLDQLNKANNARFWGQTGTLTLNQNRQFLRKQQWAVFQRGKPKAVHAQLKQGDL